MSIVTRCASLLSAYAIATPDVLRCAVAGVNSHELADATCGEYCRSGPTLSST